MMQIERGKHDQATQDSNKYYVNFSEKLITDLVEHIYLPRFSRYEIEEELKQRRQQRAHA